MLFLQKRCKDNENIYSAKKIMKIYYKLLRPFARKAALNCNTFAANQLKNLCL